jgi:hypothetical protein
MLPGWRRGVNRQLRDFTRLSAKAINGERRSKALIRFDFYSVAPNSCQIMEVDLKTGSRESSENKTRGCIAVPFGLLFSVVGVLVSVIFGLALLSYLVSRFTGGARAPNFISHSLTWFVFGGLPLFFGTLLLSHSSKPPISKRTGLILFLVFLLLGVDATVGPKNWRGVFRRAKGVQANAAALTGTLITPHLETEIRPGTNLLWCGTFQLAWNEACALAGGDLQLAPALTTPLAQNPMAGVLNKHAFAKDCIDDASYVAMADFAKNGAYQKIRTAVKTKLAFEPHLPNEALTPRPQDFIAYAALRKRLSFSVPFERLDDSFRFGDKQVRAFGISRAKAEHDAMYPQVIILDYLSETNFIIELKTTSTGDRLILAKLKPPGRLDDLVATIRARIEGLSGEPAQTNDVLIVPRISLDITRVYSELENNWLVPIGRKVANDLFLLSAMQSINFVMNEQGVELPSEAHIAFACAQEMQPARPHIMVFDEPFLVMLERKGAPAPYFVLWVDNSELLVPW